MFSLWKIMLWKNSSFKNQNIKNKKPSPKCKFSFPDKSSMGFIEKTSRFICRSLKSDKVLAGMTVEAAVVLPLFLFFFVNLGSAIEMMRLHQNLQMGLWDTGNQMCVYGYVFREKDSKTNASDTKTPQKTGISGIAEEFGDIALTYTYVKNKVVTYCGEHYLNESPLCKGTDGLQFWESEVISQDFDTEDGIIDIVMTYQVSPWLEIPFVRPFRLSNRYYGKIWNGYDPAKEADGTSSQEMVYVTENREVYHESLDCTHLKLSISTVSESELGAARNQYGRKYTLCSKCGKKGVQENGEIYICREGDFYHYRKNCSGLTRIISTITRQQAVEENLRACSRCGGK